MNRYCTEIDVEYLWVPRALGGHRGDPYVGMRPVIRWQRHLKEHLERSRDAECAVATYDPNTLHGTATLRLVSHDYVAEDWLRHGELIELLDGYKVIAVGRIVTSRQLADPS